MKRRSGRGWSEAVLPTVPVKSETQQANAVVFRARDLLVRQRTQCINALRGHLAEYGHVVPQGPAHVDALIALVEDPKSSVPESARGILQNRAAKRTLKADTHEQLRRMFRSDPSRDVRLRAMWALHVTGGWTPDALVQALGDGDDYIRA